VGDGAADGTGESESRVQVKASGSGRVSGRELSLRGIDLAGAGGGGRGVGGHFAGMDEKRRKWSGEVWWLKLDPFFPDSNPDTRPVANPPFTSPRFVRAHRLS
jgi:hypothetical protein